MVRKIFTLALLIMLVYAICRWPDKVASTIEFAFSLFIDLFRAVKGFVSGSPSQPVA